MKSIKVKWLLIIGFFLIVAGVALCVGFKLAGWDVLAWFKTQYAIYLYVCAFMYLGLLIGCVVHDYVMK